MNCPHCRVAFHSEVTTTYLGRDADGSWALEKYDCPACKRMILKLVGGTGSFVNGKFIGFSVRAMTSLVRPKVSARPPCPAEVPAIFAEDYIEACLVLADSAKASAALSRRCLQNILREVAKVKPGNLANEIQHVIDNNSLPSHLSGLIDAVRNVGNFAAHPVKSEKTGEIIAVDPLEAELTLDVIEGLFDYYFVQPEITKRKREALNKKLEEAGKPPMK